MEDLSFFVFIANMLLLTGAGILFILAFVTFLYKRQLKKLGRLSIVGSISGGVLVVWNLTMPSGEMNPSQFSGNAAIMHYFLFATLVATIITIVILLENKEREITRRKESAWK